MTNTITASIQVGQKRKIAVAIALSAITRTTKHACISFVTIVLNSLEEEFDETFTRN